MKANGKNIKFNFQRAKDEAEEADIMQYKAPRFITMNVGMMGVVVDSCTPGPNDIKLDDLSDNELKLLRLLTTLNQIIAYARTGIFNDNELRKCGALNLFMYLKEEVDNGLEEYNKQQEKAWNMRNGKRVPKSFNDVLSFCSTFNLNELYYKQPMLRDWYFREEKEGFPSIKYSWKDYIKSWNDRLYKENHPDQKEDTNY